MNRLRRDFGISEDILNFLAYRFLYSVPKEDRSEMTKFFFNIEKAYWFYEDNFCSNGGTGKLQYRLKPFAFCLFRHVPFLYDHIWNLDQILKEFNLYKKAMPRYGAVLMSTNMKTVLLVQSCWGNCTWTFPKGKAEADEHSLVCATREVHEETGFDITKLVQPDLYIEESLGGEYTRLYIVKNVPINTIFAPRTKNEIKSCKWFNMQDLLTSTEDVISKPNVGITKNTFSMKKKLEIFLKRENVEKMLIHLNEANRQRSIDLIRNEQSASKIVRKILKKKSFKCRKNVETQRVASQKPTIHSKTDGSEIINRKPVIDQIESKAIHDKSQVINRKPIIDQIESKVTTFLYDIIQVSIIFLFFVLFLDLFVPHTYTY